jgi:hypothetical protein
MTSHRAEEVRSDLFILNHWTARACNRHAIYVVAQSDTSIQRSNSDLHSRSAFSKT